MSVPALLVGSSTDALRVVDVHKLDARLDEPPRQQTALSVGGSSVAVADRLRFGRQVEGVAHLGRVQHAERLLVVSVQPARGGGVIEQLRLAIDELLHLAPVLKPFGGEAARQRKFGEREAPLVGVACHEQRIVRFAEEAGVLTRRDLTVAQDVRVGDKRRHPVRGRREPVHDRAIRRKQLLRVPQPDVVERRRVTRQRVVGRRVVVLHRVMHRSHQRDLVHHLRHFRQLVGDANPRRGGVDHSKVTPHA